MKLISAISAAAVLVTASLSASAAPTEVSHFVGSGEYASFDAFDDNSKTSLSVYRSGTHQNQTTYVNYYASSCSYTDTSFTCSGSFAWGLIPNASFQVAGQQGNADLSVDTSYLYGSTYSYTCDYIAETCSFEELPLHNGTIDAHWSRNTAFSFKTDTRQESDYINMQVVSRNRATYSSASVEANVLGMSYSSDYGQIGTSQASEHQIIRN
jgi:hypothetical protein